MAALNLETARRARLDAQRLRLESNILRLAARRQRATTHARMAGARAATGRAHARCSAPLPSPWSELRWLRVDGSLDRTLVPID